MGQSGNRVAELYRSKATVLLMALVVAVFIGALIAFSFKSSLLIWTIVIFVILAALAMFEPLGELVPFDLIALLPRTVIAAEFWRSGVKKWENMANAAELFKDEFKLPLIPPEIAAYLAGAAEVVFPVLLLVGLATRFSATALLIMTLVIQVLVYNDAYTTHGHWAIGLMMLMAFGPGRISLDHLLFGRREA